MFCVCLKIPGGNGMKPKLNTNKHVMLFLLRKSDYLLSFRKNFTEEGFGILQKIVHGLKIYTYKTCKVRKMLPKGVTIIC